MKMLLKPPTVYILDEAVKVVNFIRSEPTNSRLFKALCEEMNSLQFLALSRTSKMALSWQTRLFELRHEIHIFWEDHPFQFPSKFYDCDWLQSLAYLSDIFLQINKLNLALHNSLITVFNVSVLMFFGGRSMKEDSQVCLKLCTVFCLRTSCVFPGE
jgi:hypothetical protein